MPGSGPASLFRFVSVLVAIVAAALLAACTTQGGSAPGETASGRPALGPYCGKGDASIPGLYTMDGVPEVGSQILLRSDGSFEFFLAYGANDQFGRGCWTQNGDVIALIPEGARTITGDHTPDTRGFTGIVLIREGRELTWRIPGSRYTGRYRK